MPRSPAYDPVAARANHRLSVIYSIDDTRRVSEDFSTEFAATGHPVSAYLTLDRLGTFYDLAERQLPRVICRESLDSASVTWETAACSIVRGSVWLVALPHGSLLLALTVELDCDLHQCVAVMEDLHHRRLQIGSDELWNGCCSFLPADARAIVEGAVLGPDTYQLLVVRGLDHAELKGPDGNVDRSTVSSLVYRYWGDYEHQTVRVLYPGETNRGHGLAATGPYVGVISGLQGYVENAAFISALQFVGSESLLRRIRIEAFDELVRLRRLTLTDTEHPRTRRAILAEMVHRLGHLELELSFGVEAFDGIESLVPSLRVLDFHGALFDAASTSEESQTVGRMLERLRLGLRSCLLYTSDAADE